MKRLANQLDAPVASMRGTLHVGGQAQLEGLAQVSQMNAIEHRFGKSELLAATTNRVHRLPREGPYRTIETVAGVLSCTKEMRDGFIAVNASLASALFITALSGRLFGVGPEIEADLALPWTRLAHLIEALGPAPGSFEMSDEEAWDIVDKVAKRLWGCTALQEIARDVDAMESTSSSLAESWLIEEGLTAAWTDFVALRRRLLAEVQAAGSYSLSPRVFPLLWLDRTFTVAYCSDAQRGAGGGKRDLYLW
jgi:hypothetical protein